MDGLGFLTCPRPWLGPLDLLLPLMSSHLPVEQATLVHMQSQRSMVGEEWCTQGFLRPRHTFTTCYGPKQVPRAAQTQGPGKMGFIFWWEELQSHMAKGVATGKGGSQGHVFQQIGFDHTRGPMWDLRLPGLSLATSGFPTSALPFHLLPWPVFFPRQPRQDAPLMEATSPRICTTYSQGLPAPGIIFGPL